jgi:hypothetical protein
MFCTIVSESQVLVFHTRQKIEAGLSNLQIPSRLQFESHWLLLYHLLCLFYSHFCECLKSKSGKIIFDAELTRSIKKRLQILRPFVSETKMLHCENNVKTYLSYPDLPNRLLSKVKTWLSFIFVINKCISYHSRLILQCSSWKKNCE